jgi:uncharacterized protein YlxW (UPF0749 family)
VRDPFTFVLLLVSIIFLFQILKHKAGIRRDHRDADLPPPQDSAETRQLREEVRALKERIQVLERITVEKENSLAREIEDLRNR